MRCKACDARLDDISLKAVDPLSGEHLDLCGECRGVSDAVVGGWYEETEIGHGDEVFEFIGNILKDRIPG